MINSFSRARLDENKYLILGHLTFFVLFVFSFVLANERVLFLDSGAQVFEFIRDEGFEIYAQRYSMYLFQSLPVLAVKLHLPLSVVIYAYSLSIPAIGYLLWLITVYFLKDQKIGILMLFVLLGIRQTFFHAISETFQLMLFASFLYAWLFQTRSYQLSVFSNIWYYFIACLFVALCIFIHPVAVFFVIFILGLYILDRNKSIPQKVIIVIISIGMILFKFLDTDQGSYDTRYIISIHELFNRILNIFNLESTKWFFKHIFDFYWIPLLMFMISLCFYWKSKKYWHLAFLLCFIFGFWMITIIVYSAGGGDLGMERSFLPLFFFCGIPFMITVFPKLSSIWDKVFFTGLTVFIIVGFVKIANASIRYTERLETIDQISTLANKQGKKKLLLTAETANQLFPYSISSWGIGFESMMYSALKGIDSTVNIYVTDNIDLSEERYTDPDFYLAVPWWTYWDVNVLNPHYFRLPKQPCSVLVLENGEMIIKDL